MNKKQIGIVILIIIFVIITLFVTRSQSRRVETVTEHQQDQTRPWPKFDRPITLGNTPLLAAFATTPAQQSQGLSGQPKLSDGQGMVFDFKNSGTARPGFWMKDMLFDLDLVWVRGGRVIDITAGAKKPENFSDELPLYFPPGDVDAVIEVVSGWSDAHGLEVGDAVSF